MQLLFCSQIVLGAAAGLRPIGFAHLCSGSPQFLTIGDAVRWALARLVDTARSGARNTPGAQGRRILRTHATLIGRPRHARVLNGPGGSWCQTGGWKYLRV